jgi:transcriptional antiterminator
MGLRGVKRDLKNIDRQIRKRISGINASLKKAGIKIIEAKDVLNPGHRVPKVKKRKSA